MIENDAESALGKICPFCVTPIESGKVIVCSDCKKPHHNQCWIYNLNRCTTLSCRGKGFESEFLISSENENLRPVYEKPLKAENEKIAAKDFATAKETEDDGVRRAKIKEAEGTRQAKILEAQGQAEAIKLVNESADKHFVGNAQLLKKLETVENSLQRNAKIVIPANTELVNVIGEMSGVMPLKDKRNK